MAKDSIISAASASLILEMNDQDANSPMFDLSIALQSSNERRLVLSATRVASIPAGTSSESVWEVLIAEAANEPVHNPKM